jgi:hypothetical protein
VIRRPARTRAVSGALAAALVFGACGGSHPAVDRANARQIVPLDAGVPIRIAGLEVVEEDISDTINLASRPYLDAAALYSIRDQDLLQATLQVGRFSDDVDATDEEFALQLVTLVGAGAREFRIGDQKVYVTGADRQTLSIWFKANNMFILSTRDTFDGGRSLLRSVIEEVAP